MTFLYKEYFMQTILIILITCFFGLYCFLNSIDINEQQIEIRIIDQNTAEPQNMDTFIIKVNNISDLNSNFSTECCICMDSVDPIDSYRLSGCDYHIFHEECAQLYIENNFIRCPICNT